ncbi:N-acetyltransferase [Bacillus sp. FJAT-42376]|uniref:GNAT family N-acetyltransferase n=1 Tax=Bacillus sp. FJAT-42376 TaxID=2014076 RepID=UPI000F4F1702|nr:GNAT family protein [Bacillus sp. FJAT-42376]AZB42314.1 N-acetyltransferase [Bacillus sp. FJAT-42376]
MEENDLEELYQLRYGEEHPEWKKWDAPYFPHERISFEEYKMKQAEKQQGMEAIIQAGKKTIGTIIYYWEHQPSNWLEIGITIYLPEYWNGGYGTEALSLWMDHLFETMSIPRVGITTWSGNERMMRAAEKQGMKLEGRMRKCRYYNGEYYDSIRMGILREEWETRKSGGLPVYRA